MSQMPCHTENKRPLLHCSEKTHIGLVHGHYLWLHIPISVSVVFWVRVIMQ